MIRRTRADGSPTLWSPASSGSVPDRGSATLLLSAAIALLVLLGTTGVGIGEFAAARARASSAADLSALAGASKLLIGGECDEAARIAEKGGAQLVYCARSHEDLVVTVSVQAPRILRTLAGLAGQRPPQIQAQARAGPRS